MGIAGYRDEWLTIRQQRHGDRLGCFVFAEMNIENCGIAFEKIKEGYRLFDGRGRTDNLEAGPLKFSGHVQCQKCVVFNQ